MVLGARLRTVMSPIIRWRKAEILPAGGTEYAEGLLLLMRATVMENPVERHVGDSGNQVGVTTRRSWQPNATRRVSTFVDIVPLRWFRSPARRKRIALISAKPTNHQLDGKRCAVNRSLS